MIRGGEIEDLAAARLLGITRARMSQIMGLELLAPEIQEAILHLDAVDGVAPVAERTLRADVHHENRAAQRRA